MLHRFSNFEIDEPRRALRAAGRLVEPQRRVFDLLIYLVRHADRVVPKAELLDAVWPGVLVTDNSLQRAVSLARSTLTQAGCAATIRTHLRQGYRFCAARARSDEPPPAPAPPPALLRARAASARSDWAGAMAALRELEQPDALTTDDLRLWFHIAQCAGGIAAAIAVFERAVSIFRQNQAIDRAACAAILLAQLRLDASEPALAKGWLQRAARQLAGVRETREHGYLNFALCRLALFENNLDDAVRFADLARDIGDRLHDPDLHTLGLLYGGEGRLYRGEIQAGLAAIDEAGAAVVAFNLGPWTGGLVFCGIIFSSLTRADWHRAAQWNQQFDRWCQLHQAPGAIGLCRLHQAEVLCIEGKLTAAEREARHAQAALARNAPWAEGDAWRVLGEIQLARGDWTRARKSLARAHAAGWSAPLGLALLEDAQGRTAQSRRLLARALRDSHWSNRARRGLLLAHFAEIAARDGHADDARTALAEIDARPELVSSSALQALVLRARGELAAAEGNPSQAADFLQSALRRWTTISAPLLAAQTRCRLAALLRAEGDAASAELELAAARAAFQKAGARGLLAGCERPRNSRPSAASAPTTASPGRARAKPRQ